jgi:tRNA pseudouridine38-40 synthase
VVSVPTASALEPRRIARGLAGILPHDLGVRAVTDAPAGFDARRDAHSRRYEYRLLTGPDSPLRRGRVHEVRNALDLPAMRRAARLVVGRHDFRACTPTQTEHVFFHRTVMRAQWEARADELVLVIEADAFLRSMVRVIAGTLLEVGRGRRRAATIAELVKGAPRAAAGPTLPAHALTLVGVRYDRPPGQRLA